ncbi:MAG: hypothetical protein PHO66_06210 [Eubacteriales bacterium]|nr:hypothetical protein [Eubacteriales bacterium]
MFPFRKKRRYSQPVSLGLRPQKGFSQRRPGLRLPAKALAVHPLIWVGGAAALLVGVLIFAIVKLASPTVPTPENPALPGDTPPVVSSDRATRLSAPSSEPPQSTARFIGFGAQDFHFAEKQINQPAIFDTEIIFSAGTGSLSGPVLNKLYYYNLDTGEENKLSESTIYQGEYYETLISHDWIVWLETDHGKNNKIYTMNRANGAVSMVKNCENGKPKLRLYGSILIWMEQVENNLDQLYMFDLVSQENLSLFQINEVSTYGVSAPCIYEDTIVWSGPDTNQTQEDKTANGDKSSVYWVNLGEDTFTGDQLNTQSFSPGTYVHEPLYNGEYFVWIDSNKSPNSNLYIARANEEPRLIAAGVTAYSMGDGIVVYGKDQGVWCYVIDTGEICRLTYEGEKGMLPLAQNRTVVWYNLSANSEKDMLRYKVLDEQDIHPQWPLS